MDLHPLKIPLFQKSSNNNKHMARAIVKKPDSKAQQLELARVAAIANINLIYDALAAISRSDSSPAAHNSCERNCSDPVKSCEDIDLAIRDSLSDALTDVSWTLSTCTNAPPELRRIQAKVILGLVEEDDDSLLGALVYAVASGMSNSDDCVAEGEQSSPGIRIKSGC
jgi:hypothetical protein